MSKENVEIVRGGYEAFRRGDVEAVFALLDPAVEYYQSDEVPWGGRYRGPAGVGEFFQKLRASGKVVRFEAYIDHPKILAALP